MPQYSINITANPGSDASTTPPPKAAPPSPQFAKSQQSSSPSSPNRPENSPDSAGWSSSETRSPEELSPEELSPEATDCAVGCLFFDKHCPQLPAVTRPDLEAFAFEHSCFCCDNALFRPEDHIVHKKALPTAWHSRQGGSPFRT
jgi:hypothetical protein